MYFLSIIILIKFFQVVKCQIFPSGENAIADIFSLMRGTSLYYSVFD